MPLSDQDKLGVLQELGYDSTQYDVDESNYRVIPKVKEAENKIQPTSGSPSPVVKATPANPKYTPWQTAKMNLAHEALPSFGAGLGAAGAMTAAGALISATGVGAPIGIPLTLLGAGVGGYLGHSATQAAQDAIIPDSMLQELNAASQQNPKSAMMGGLAAMPFGGFNLSPTKALQALGTAGKLVTRAPVIQKEMQNLMNVGTGAAMGGAGAIADPLLRGQRPTVGGVLSGLGTGAVFNNPNRIGQSMGFHPAGEAFSAVGSEVDPSMFQDIPKTGLPANQAQTIPVPKLNPIDLINNITSSGSIIPRIDPVTNAKRTGGEPINPEYRQGERIVPSKSAEESAIDMLRALNKEEKPLTRKEVSATLEPDYKTPEQIRAEDYVKALQELATKEENRLAQIEHDKAAAERNAIDPKLQEQLKMKLGVKATPEAIMGESLAATPEAKPAPISLEHNPVTGKNEPRYHQEIETGKLPRVTPEESAAELEATRLEERLAKEERSRYSDEPSVDNPEQSRPRLSEENQLNEDLKRTKVPRTPTGAFYEFFKNLGVNLRNTHLTADDTIVNADGKPVAGQSFIRQHLETALAKLNPNKQSADTAPHEMMGHIFYNDLAKSPRARDQMAARGYRKTVEGSEQFRRINEQRVAKGLKPWDAEEYIANQSATHLIRRGMNLDNENPTTRWLNDYKSYLKTRYSKHATENDFARLLTQKFYHDEPFSKVHGVDPLGVNVKGGLVTPTITTSPATVRQSDEPSIPKEEPLISKNGVPPHHPSVRERLDAIDTYDWHRPQAKFLDAFAGVKDAMLDQLDFKKDPELRTLLMEVNPRSEESWQPFYDYWDEHYGSKEWNNKTDSIKYETKPVSKEELTTVEKEKAANAQQEQKIRTKAAEEFNPETDVEATTKQQPTKVKKEDLTLDEMANTKAQQGRLQEAIKERQAREQEVEDPEKKRLRNEQSLNEWNEVERTTSPKKTAQYLLDEIARTEEHIKNAPRNSLEGNILINRMTGLRSKYEYLVSKHKKLSFKELEPVSRYSDEPSVSEANLQTETPEFKKWFGNSKVVDDEGKPLVVYHGTRELEPINVLDRQKGKVLDSGYFGQGTYLTSNPDYAQQYTRRWNDKETTHGPLMPVYASIKNPADLSVLRSLSHEFDNYGKFHSMDESKRVTNLLKEMGYDGVVIKTGGKKGEPYPYPFDPKAKEQNYDAMGYSKYREIVAFYPEQIKSAIGNKGTFDASNPDIRYANEPSIDKQTETPAFKRWFGESKVTDSKTGKPMRLYHGTATQEHLEPTDFHVFNTKRPYNPSRAEYLGGDRNEHYGIYMTPKPKYSESYTGSLQKVKDGNVQFTYDKGARILPLYAKIENPFETFWGYGFLSKERVAELRAAGHDGVFAYKDQFGPRGESLTLPEKFAQVNKNRDLVEVVAFDPEQVKSAIGNTGEFSSTNPDIRYANEPSVLGPMRAEIDKIPDEDVRKGFAETYHQYNSLRGQFQHPIAKLLKFIDWSAPINKLKQDSPEMQRVVNRRFDMQETGHSNITLTAREQQIDDIVKDILLDTVNEKNARPNLPTTIPGPNYLPQSPNRKVLDILLNNPTSPEARQLLTDWDNYYRSKGKTQVEADEAYKIFKAGYTKQKSNLAKQFGPIDESAGIGIPRSWRKTDLVDLMSNFTDRYARRLAYHDNIENNPVVNDKLFNDKTGLEAHDSTKTVLEDIMGVKEHSEALRSAISGVVRAGMLGTLTGAKDVVSSQTLGLQHQNLDQVIPAKLAAWNNVHRNIDESLKAGVNRVNVGSFESGDGGVDQVSSILRKTRDVINTVQGRNYLEQVARAVAFGEGKFLAMDNMWRAHQGNVNSTSKRFLDSFVPDWQSNTSGQLTPKQLADSASRYVESVQGTYDYRGLPAVAQKGTLAPYLSLARWNIEKLNNFEKHVINPARKGDIKPLLMSTLGMIIGGEAVNQLVKLATKREERTPTYKEIEVLQEEGKDVLPSIVYKAAGLASMSGYGGLLGDVIKSGMDLNFKNRVQTYDNPMITGLATITGTVADGVTAMQNGDLDNGLDFISQFMEDMFQSYRLGLAHVSPEKQKEIEQSNKLRDLKLYKVTHDEPVGDVLKARSDPFRDADMKKFKRTDDLSEAKDLLQGLLQKALVKSAGNPERLKAELLKLKMNSYQTMPSPESMPRSFSSYLSFLTKTQGAEVASARLLDYFKQREVNKVKSSMVPTMH